MTEIPDEEFLETKDEDYIGQKDEMRRAEIVSKAVAAADAVIMQGSNGIVEETDYLTARVADQFMDKVVMRITSELLRRDLLDKRPDRDKRP